MSFTSNAQPRGSDVRDGGDVRDPVALTRWTQRLSKFGRDDPLQIKRASRLVQFGVCHSDAECCGWRAVLLLCAPSFERLAGALSASHQTAVITARAFSLFFSPLNFFSAGDPAELLTSLSEKALSIVATFPFSLILQSGSDRALESTVGLPDKQRGHNRREIALLTSLVFVRILFKRF